MTQLTVTPNSIIIGVDVHKYTHQAVALSYTGQILSSYTFSNQSLPQYQQWLTSLGKKQSLVIGLEDIHGYGYHLNQFLTQHDYQVRYVPPILTADARKKSFHGEKTDQEDAKRVGKVILHDLEKTLPATAIVTESDKQKRLLKRYLQQRRDLVAHQTALKNQLHTLLHEYYGDSYHHEFKTIFTQTAMAWYQQDLQLVAAMDLEAEDLLRQFELLQIYQKQIKVLSKRVTQLGKQLTEIKKLRTLPGCGSLLAAQIVAEIGKIDRFATESKLARYAGIAPVSWESAGKGHYHTDCRGNRSLNYAIHRIALSQVGGSGLPQAKAYHQRKQQEKHSKLWSLRCLKRHLVRRIFILLSE